MTKYRKKGQIDLLEKIPEKKFDWEAFWGFIFIAVIAIGLLSNCSG